MTNHWPDLEKCKRLRERGFPQNTHFTWCHHGPDDSSESFVEYGKIECELSNGGCAAPIATELVEEIFKMLEVPAGDAEGDSMLIAHLFENSCSVYVPTQTLQDIANHADTLPNVLSDLWCWLKERET